MKKLLTLVWVCCVLLSMAVGTQAASTTPYQLGDKMDDFTVTLNDGNTYTLSSLLKDKKAVIINFWTSWCEPCKEELPFMEEVLHEYADDIAILALTAHAPDTMEVVEEIRQECGLTDMPLGLDVGLYKNFVFGGYPATVVIDRNGVICYAKGGKFPSKEHFLRLVAPYIVEDYSAPVLLEAVPAPVVMVEQPTEADLKAALNMKNAHLSIIPIADDSTWPFVPDKRGGAAASNTQFMSTKSELTIHVEAGAGAGLSFKSNAQYAFVRDGLLSVSVDGQPKLNVPNSENWKTNYISLGDTSIAHDVVFSYGCDENQDEPTYIAIKDIAVLNDKEYAKLLQAEKVPVNKLSDELAQVELISGAAKPIAFTSSDGTSGEGSAYVTMDEDLEFRIRVGNALDVRTAVVVTPHEAIPLHMLPCDEDGYLIRWTNPHQTYRCNTIDVFSSIDNMEADGLMELYDSEASLNEWITMVNERYPETNMDWLYVDGSPKQAMDSTAPAAASSTESTYEIHVTDADGKPLEGVFIKFCDEDSCQALFTDAYGLVVQTAEPKTYEVHVLMVPDGFLPDESAYSLPPEGGELTIVLSK